MDDEVMGNPSPETFTETQGTETEAEASVDALIDLETEASTADDEAPKDETPQPRKLKVKIDGQELEVDEEEAAKGYQRQADYSRNMQRVQAEMQQAQAMQARYQQQLEQFIPESVARIQALQQAAEQYRQEGNTEALSLIQYDLQAEVMRYQQASAAQQQIQEEQVARSQQHRQMALKTAEQAVYESIPEWKNQSVRKAEIGEVTKVITDFVAKNYGDQAQSILSDINDGLYGPMPIVLAREAMLYRKLMAKVAARKAGQSEQTSAPAPAQSVRTSGGKVSKDPADMNPKEFAEWRRNQIAKR